MTYLNKLCSTSMIEASLSSAQTVSSGDMVLFDTIRATHSHGVSLNATTGEVTLDTSKHYRIQASVDVTRSNTSTSYRFAWIDSSGVEISAADGGYDASWNLSSTANATYTAMYQSVSPVSPIRLKVTSVSANSTLNLATKLIILEITP